MRARLPTVALVLLTACGGASSSATSTTAAARTTLHPGASVDRGRERMMRGDCSGALREDFGPLVEDGERAFAGRVVRSARTRSAADALRAATTEDGSTVVVDPDYPDTIYLAAFCAIELGDLPLGECYLTRALEIIAEDPAYLSELGHIHQTRHDFDKALETFTRAQAAVVRLEAGARTDETAPSMLDHDLPWWHRRTLRGIGLSLIELGRLDEAEDVYRRVLAIHPGDEQARTELRYIEEQRIRARANTL